MTSHAGQKIIMCQKDPHSAGGWEPPRTTEGSGEEDSLGSETAGFIGLHLLAVEPWASFLVPIFLFPHL